MRLWMVFVPMFGVLGLGKLYDVWKASDPLPQTVARRECLSKLKGMDARIDRVGICDCALRKARAWKSDNPDAEYTLAVHQRVIMPCFEAAAARAETASSEFGVFSSEPSPQRRSYGADEPTSAELGWGKK